jgi:hypothetical protein
VETAVEVILTMVGVGILAVRAVHDRTVRRRNLAAIGLCPTRCRVHRTVRVIDLDAERRERRPA